MVNPLRKALRLLAGPARTAGGRGGAIIQTYNGCGSQDEVFLIGRVLRQPRFGLGKRADALERDLVDLLRRLLRRGVPGTMLEACLCGAKQRVVADGEGFFTIRLRPANRLPKDRVWHPVRLSLVEPRTASTEAEALVFVPRSASYVVISDIDDTVVYTGVANKLGMLWRLFIEGARSRVAFPGVAAFYRALHSGKSGAETNPMVYVSRGPWSLYEVLEAFFRLHGIPVGPVLFLRKWGLTLQRPLPRQAVSHKYDLLREMLALYKAYPVVLIGDSGQHDPELYARVVRENPGRVAAVYIRNVSRAPGRRRAIEALAQELSQEDSPLLLASDSFVMAEHAATLGLISPAALTGILAEKAAEEGED